MERMTSVSPKHTAANQVTRSGSFRREKELDEIAELRHKLTKAKNDIVELVAKHNEELSSCESRSAKLRSEVEKGKAVWQSLEYDLAVARKQCSMERMALQEEKDSAFVKQELFKAQIEELQKKILLIEEKFQHTQFGWHETQKKLESEFKDQELQIDNHKKHQEMLTSEKNSLEARIQKQNLITQALQQKLKELDIEKNSYVDIVRRQKSEIAFGLEREDRLKQELVTANQRVKRLEENIEAERAAHLESKYNCEIIQLRIQDLESSLQVEKANRAHASSDLDLIRSQFREVENAYNREEASAKEFADKLHKLEKEYSYMGNQFKAEIEKQNKMIADLSVKLKTSEETLAVMDQDLEKSKKYQISLEEAYGCNVRELQTLVESFNTPSHRTSGTSSDKDKAAGPAVLQALRHTLTDYQNKLGSASNELETQKHVCARMKEDLESSKKMIHTLQINIENVRSKQLVSEKELQSLGTACAERDSQIVQIQTELVKTREGRDKEQRRAIECECELQKKTQTFQKDAEEKLTFLHGLYQRLVAGCVLLKEPESTTDNFSWPELCVILEENVTALISDLRQAKEKVSYLEYACKNKADVLRDLQKKHEDSLDRLAQQMKEQQSSWEKKTKDLEQHYSVLLGEINSRAQKYQRIAEKSKDKISIYEKTKDQMAVENVHVKNLLISTENDHKCLLAACALLAGALYPLYSRASTLAAQRNFLEDQMNTYVEVQNEIRCLVQALSESEVERNANSKRRPKHPRCMKRVFRRGVIAVLAANRLQKLGRSSRTMFMWQEGTNRGPGLLVCPGGSQYGKTLTQPDGMMFCQEAWKWITSTDLLSTINSSMSDLLEVLNQRDPDSRSQRQLIATARNCFSKLMSKLDVRSEARCLQLRRYSIAVSPDSLVRRLTRGLHRINTRALTTDLTSTTPIMKCLAILKKQILSFTQRLHESEVERRSLRLELSGIKQKISGISKDVGGVETFKAQDKQSKQSKVISYEKFRTVFDELNSALLREHEAQILLHEQSQQLLELSHKIELHSQEEAEKDQTLEETVKSLTEMKMELWRKDQSLREQNRQLTQLEQDRRRLEASISSAESALRTAVREKEVLLNYMKSVATAFQKIRDQTSLARAATSRQDFTFQLPNLPPKMFGTEELTGGSDLTVFQSMVNSFLDVYQLACSKATTLESQTTLDTGTLRSTGGLYSGRSATEFVPLQAETDFSQSHTNFSNVNSRTFQPMRFSSVSDLAPTTMQDLPASTQPLPSQR